MQFIDLKTFFVGGGLAFAAVLFLLHQFQEKLLYHPQMPGAPQKPGDNPPGYRSPADYGIDFEDLYVTTSDNVRIHAWFLKQPLSRSKPTILFFHGNAGNIGFRLPNAKSMFERTQSNVVLVDYRGFGNSQGTPTEPGLLLDAQAILTYLRSRSDVDDTRIVLFGRSLGGAVALALAEVAGPQIRAIVLENTFLSIGHMVDHLMPLVKYVKSWVLHMHWDNLARIPGIRHPILFFAGEADELVPHAHMRLLHDSALRSATRRFVPVVKGTHNDTWMRGGRLYMDQLAAFVAEVTDVASTEAAAAAVP